MEGKDDRTSGAPRPSHVDVGGMPGECIRVTLAIALRIIAPGNRAKKSYDIDINSNYGAIQLNILSYKLHRGHESEGIYLEKAINSLSNAENVTIQNSIFDKTTLGKIKTLPDKMVAKLDPSSTEA